MLFSKDHFIIEYSIVIHMNFSLFLVPGMIFGIGAAAIFYVTTGQCYNDTKFALTNICCSRSSPNPDYEELPEERHLILEQGGARNESSVSSAIANERKPLYGS